MLIGSFPFLVIPVSNLCLSIMFIIEGRSQHGYICMLIMIISCEWSTEDDAQLSLLIHLAPSLSVRSVTMHHHSVSVTHS